MRRTFTIANAVLAAINLLVWGGFIWLGIDLVRGVTAQHAPGYPNHGQITYYIRFPILMAVLTLSVYLLSRFTRYGGVALALQIFLLLTFFPFVLTYTGGM
jgi:hypothetical protein